MAANMDRLSAAGSSPGKRRGSYWARVRGRRRMQRRNERYTIAGPCTVMDAEGTVLEVRDAYTEAEQDRVKSGKGRMPAARILDGPTS